MPRLDYNGYSFDIGLRDEDEIFYVVVYTGGNYSYIEKHFPDIESALDFEQDDRINCLKLTFVYIKYKKEVAGEFHRFCKVNFTNDKNTPDWAYSRGYKRTIECEHKFVDYTFRVVISNIDYAKNENIGIYFGKRGLDQKPYNGIYSTTFSNKDYNEFIPEFASPTSPIFLKILFLFDVMIRHYEIDNLSQLEIKLRNSKVLTDYYLNKK